MERVFTLFYSTGIWKMEEGWGFYSMVIPNFAHSLLQFYVILPCYYKKKVNKHVICAEDSSCENFKLS